MKIEKVIWFTSGSDTIGIALVDNGQEKKAYIKKVVGFDQDEDATSIMESGSKLLLSDVEEIVRHLK